jgi:hypothetical protein
MHQLQASAMTLSDDEAAIDSNSANAIHSARTTTLKLIAY